MHLREDATPCQDTYLDLMRTWDAALIREQAITPPSEVRQFFRYCIVLRLSRDYEETTLTPVVEIECLHLRQLWIF